MSVMAHGVRGKSGKGSAAVASFASGDLTVYLKAHRDLHTMKDFACVRLREGLGRDVLRFAGASTAAELVLSHAEQEPHEDLFEALESALDRMETVREPDVPAAVLAGLWTMIEALGFAPQIDVCVECDAPLSDTEVGRFDLSAGGIRCARCGEGRSGPRVGPGAREQLETLLAGGLPPGLTRARQHLALVADFVTYHVAPKPLKSFRFLDGMLPEDAEAVS